MSKHRNANAYCSFCRKSYREVGPLVEGPGSVYICGECVELCQSIIVQEKRRRRMSPEAIQGRLDELIGGQQEAKRALVLAARRLDEARRHVLLLGDSRSTKVLLTRALAHVLQVPFAGGDWSALSETRHDSGAVVPLLYQLLDAADFDVEAAQHGVVYVEGIDRPGAADVLLPFWEGRVSNVLGHMRFDPRALLFVCGGTNAFLTQTGTDPDQPPDEPVSEAALLALGVPPALVRHLVSSARVTSLDEEALGRLAPLVDFRQPGSGGVSGEGTQGGHHSRT